MDSFMFAVVKQLFTDYSVHKYKLSIGTLHVLLCLLKLHGSVDIRQADIRQADIRQEGTRSQVFCE